MQRTAAGAARQEPSSRYGPRISRWSGTRTGTRSRTPCRARSSSATAAAAFFPTTTVRISATRPASTPTAVASTAASTATRGPRRSTSASRPGWISRRRSYLGHHARHRAQKNAGAPHFTARRKTGDNHRAGQGGRSNRRAGCAGDSGANRPRDPGGPRRRGLSRCELRGPYRSALAIRRGPSLRGMADAPCAGKEGASVVGAGFKLTSRSTPRARQGPCGKTRAPIEEYQRSSSGI